MGDVYKVPNSFLLQKVKLIIIIPRHGNYYRGQCSCQVFFDNLERIIEPGTGKDRAQKKKTTEDGKWEKYQSLDFM